MMAWSNTCFTPVFSCLFVLLSYLVNVFFLMCLLLSDVYSHVPYSDAIDAETGSVELICMYVSLLHKESI
jgi:hypothetical protein